MSSSSSRRSSPGGRLLDRLLGRGTRAHPGPRSLLESRLGPLEVRVLKSLWRQADAAGVRDILRGFPGVAYTTLMTTLDRLYKKGFLERRKDGRAYLYVPRYRRHDLEALLARDAIDDLLREGARARGADPILAGFVQAVSERDARMLDELERLVRRYRTTARHPRRGGDA